MDKHIIDKKLFFEFVNLLESNNIFFWLEAGTLLGAYRDKRFITEDDDVDISLWSSDYWKIRQLIDLSNWEYKSIWRRELAIYNKSNLNFHIDLFFFDKNENTCDTYSYLENKITKNINIESKIVIPNELLKEFKNLSFYKHKFNIPKLTDKYLECQYGNWKTPTTQWYYSKKTNIDRNHSSLAIIIPTFLREEKLINCVTSILKTHGEANRFQSFFKIYIGEQGDVSPNKQQFYNKLDELGHIVCKLPYNAGLSYTRNYLISQTKEPYILVIDDDYIFNEMSYFEPFFRILLEDENIGLVGGKLNNQEQQPTQILVEQSKNEINSLVFILSPIKYSKSKKTLTQKSYDYFESEYILNFFLAKREVFNDIAWDNELKLVEHSDFMLRLKSTKWKVCYTPDIMIEHHPENNSEEYKSYRDAKTGKNCISGLYKFRQKYNIRSVNKWIFSNEIHNRYLTSSKIKIVQLARIPCANSGLELSNLINKFSQTYESRYILGNEYSNKNTNIPYRKFPTDLYWETQKEECLKILKEADIIHVHHDIIDDPELKNIIKTKKVVWTLYNLSQSLQYQINNFNQNYIRKCQMYSNVITVADQSLQKILFSDITDIKVPLIKMLFNENTEKNNVVPIIVFAPTNKLNEGIGSKKYPEVLRIINELKQEGYS
ncbi:MAG: glycosyltransferase, partial [Clostridia bacterium]